MHTHIYIYVYIRGADDKFPDFFVWAFKIFVDSWKFFIGFRQGRVRLYDLMAHAFNKFPDFFIQAFKSVIDSWEFSMLLLYIWCDDWPTFMISGSNEQLQQQLEYTLLNPDCHRWWISKIQSGREEERYAIKFCFKLGKNDATETYGMLQTAFRPSCMNRASVFEWHKRFKEGSGSVRNNERCGRSKEVSTPELIGQRVRVEVLKEFRKTFLGKRLALFKSGQWHFHQNNAPVHNSILVTDYSTKMGIKTVPQPPYKSRPFLLWLIP